jgi:pyridoxal phosphate phosphatase PHOSPHO2
MKRAVTNLKKRGDTTFLCLSNSNEVYIGTILEVSCSSPSSRSHQHHGLTHLFDKVITNPAHWDGDRLHIGRRLPADGPQHGCTVGCLPNMCKGDELDAWVAAHGGKEAWDKMVYVGDGGNDYCPLLRMRKGDLACVRKGYELGGRIEREGKKDGFALDVEMWDQAWIIDE